MNTLAMIRLKQNDLAKINTLAIYSSTQLDFLVNTCKQLINTVATMRNEIGK